jgi:capsular polysaccharide biosynthesis protein
VRAITNYEEMKLAIKDHYPELHLMEHTTNYPLENTINLWNSAKIVIGAHGEALTNLIWCSPSTTVIEFLHTQSETYGHYYWIANSMDLTYWVVPVLNATIQTNYTIPIQKVLNILQKTTQFQ